ncbi:MAG: hypothetical protein KAV82_08225 [Phycisphaerae bacterium]|nr:hypothetical protein [Phycisphaerae bacterium]
MNDSKASLYVLLMEDDAENLELLQKTLPAEIDKVIMDWEPCDDFDDALRRITQRRYDLIVTDIYRDRTDREKGVNVEDEKAYDLISEIRRRRFCSVVAFTDGSMPQSFTEGPFVKLADKSKGNDDIVDKITELLHTGIPLIAQKLHDELDRTAGSYLWDFLEEHWDQLEKAGATKSALLERLVRRRAATQLGRLDMLAECPQEVEAVEGLEFYIRPPISRFLRLGMILRHKNSGGFRVVMTPHCHMTVQTGKTEPGADFVLTVQPVLASELLKQNPPKGKAIEKLLNSLRRRTGSPADIGKPNGRYWFLPGFLDVPDLFCDFCRLSSVPYDTLEAEYERVAVLDTPYAEALQSCFSRFYGAVGLTNLTESCLRGLLTEHLPNLAADAQ